MTSPSSVIAFLASCLLLLAISECASGAVLQVAGLITNSTLGLPPGTNYNAAKLEAPALVRGWKLWQEEVNKRGIAVGTTTYYVNLTIIDVGGSYETVFNVTTAVARGDFGPYSFILGPWGSDYSLAAALAVEPFDTVLITNVASAQSVFVCPSGGIAGCPETGARRVTHAFGAVPTAENFYGAAINLLVIEGAKTIAIYNEVGLFQNSSRVSAVAAANDYGLEILMDKQITVNPNNETVVALTRELAELDADIVFGSQFYGGTVAVVKEMKRIGYTPGALIMRLNYGNLRDVLGDDARYLIDTLFFDERLKGEDYNDDLYFSSPGAVNDTNAIYTTSDPSPLRFAKSIRAKFGSNTILASDPVSFLQGEIIDRAILRAKSVAAADVRAVIPELIFRSFMGRVAFNTYGYNDKTPPVTIQRDENWDLQVVSPIGTATRNIIYPMPDWSQREASFQYYGLPSEIAILVITLISMAASVAFAIFVVVNWDNKIVRAGSPPFMLLVVAGSILTYVGVLTWPLHTDASLCLATPWMLAGGFVLLFSALFSRTYRLMKIFTDENLNKTFRVSDTQLYVVVFVLEGIIAIVLVLWTAISPQEAVLIVPDPTRPALNYMQCQTSNVGTVFLAISGAYMFLIIIVGVIMSVRIWNIPYEIYSESKYIGFAMYNLLFFFILAIICGFVFSGAQREVSYILRSICIILGNGITMCCLFIPKMRLVATGVDTKKSWGDKVASDSTSTSTMRHGTASAWTSTAPVKSEIAANGNDTDDSEDTTALKKQNDKLKKKVNRLQIINAELQAQLAELLKDKEESGNGDDEGSATDDGSSSSDDE